MRTTLKYGFVALLLTTGFAQAADAHGYHPCKAEHMNAKTACASDKHSPDCKAAHKATQDCRVRNGMPPHGKKAQNAGTPATPQGSNAPATPQ